MIPVNCKRLIEVDFPIARVSEHSAKEKSIRHGHPSTLHLWWARRPLAACRAVLLGLLLPAPTDRECPADFKSKARALLAKRYSGTGVSPVGHGQHTPAAPPVNSHGQDAHATTSDQQLQDLLLKFIGEFADWDHAANALYLEIGRGLVKAAHPEETPVVVDPFSGGGSIPLEALRLGCEAFASDLNPVACLILKTLLEDIPRYGNAEFRFKRKKPRINTNEHESKNIGVHSCPLVVEEEEEVVIHGLADALRHVGKSRSRKRRNRNSPSSTRPTRMAAAPSPTSGRGRCAAKASAVVRRFLWCGRFGYAKEAIENVRCVIALNKTRGSRRISSLKSSHREMKRKSLRAQSIGATLHALAARSFFLWSACERNSPKSAAGRTLNSTEKEIAAAAQRCWQS
jgi:hypothetical protein